jgi:uncharacterized membrane protein
MPRLTIGLWLAYVAISLGMRLVIQLRMTGQSGFVLHRHPSSPLQLFASALFVASLLAGLISPVLAVSFPGHPLSTRSATSMTTAPCART